ncbi:hypothetical protein BH11CYA1_BH11CYA1_38400 [soil metagenome]
MNESSNMTSIYSMGIYCRNSKSKARNRQTTALANASREKSILAKATLAILLSLTCAWQTNASPINRADKSQSNNEAPAHQTLQAISSTDLEFGEQQLQKMLKDRRHLSEILQKKEPIWPWAVRQFAKEAGSERIFWNSTELTEKGYEYDSDHRSPSPGKPGYIRLRKTDQTGKLMAANRLLAAFVFESFNMRNSKAFEKLETEALHGKYSKNQYMDAGAKIDFAATRKTAEFYKTVYLPLANKRHYDTDTLYWEAETPATFAAWRAQYTDPKGYPWSFWGKDYDERIAPYLKAVKHNKVARELYESDLKKYKLDLKKFSATNKIVPTARP